MRLTRKLCLCLCFSLILSMGAFAHAASASSIDNISFDYNHEGKYWGILSGEISGYDLQDCEIVFNITYTNMHEDRGDFYTESYPIDTSGSDVLIPYEFLIDNHPYWYDLYLEVYLNGAPTGITFYWR